MSAATTATSASTRYDILLLLLLLPTWCVYLLPHLNYVLSRARVIQSIEGGAGNWQSAHLHHIIWHLVSGALVHSSTEYEKKSDCCLYEATVGGGSVANTISENNSCMIILLLAEVLISNILYNMQHSRLLYRSRSVSISRSIR